jgi:hypothetical protein
MNGELLLSARPLQNGEKMKLGGTEFIFVQFCGDNFSWEEYFN